MCHHYPLRFISDTDQIDTWSQMKGRIRATVYKFTIRGKPANHCIGRQITYLINRGGGLDISLDTAGNGTTTVSEVITLRQGSQNLYLTPIGLAVYLVAQV